MNANESVHSSYTQPCTREDKYGEKTSIHYALENHVNEMMENAASQAKIMSKWRWHHFLAHAFYSFLS